MRMYEDVWDSEDKRRRDNYEKNKACFERLSDSAKLKILWAEYVEKNIDEPELYSVLSEYER